MSKQTYIVYVHDDPCCIKSWNGNVIDQLWALPDDDVGWVNRATQKMTITFNEGTEPNAVFEEKSISIGVNGSVETTVTGSLKGETDCNITPCVSELPIIEAAPKVKVGEGP